MVGSSVPADFPNRTVKYHLFGIPSSRNDAIEVAVLPEKSTFDQRRSTNLFSNVVAVVIPVKSMFRNLDKFGRAYRVFDDVLC